MTILINYYSDGGCTTRSELDRSMKLEAFLRCQFDKLGSSRPGVFRGHQGDYF